MNAEPTAADLADQRTVQRLAARPADVAGGLAVWVRARRGVRVRAWVEAAARRGLAFTPGAAHLPAGELEAFRAGFATLSPPELARVVDLLGASLPVLGR